MQTAAEANPEILVIRALAGFYRAANLSGRPVVRHPDPTRSDAPLIEGRRYVALRDSAGLPLVVFRVKTRGNLKAMHLPPRALREPA